MFYKGERGVKVMLIIKLIISIVGAYIMGVIGSIEASSNYFTNRNNLGLNEILLFFSFTLSIAVILVMYYKSSSLKKLLNIFFKILWLELIIASFITGASLLKLNELYDKFLKANPLIAFYFILISFIFCLILESVSKYTIVKESDLYESRKNYLLTIDSYLETMESFSIVGKWGIGKTKLIENFFEKECEIEEGKGKFYKDKYEYIYIDSSIYSENQKIIETLEKELLKKFKKYKVLKLKNSFIKNVFLQNETILKILYNFFDFEISPKGETEQLAKELKEKNKTLVICLDNLERLGSRERISNLFAIIDELISENIKKIYIYDEEYMKKIFKKDKEDFIDYIRKYTFNIILLNGMKLKDIKNDEIRNFIKTLKYNYERVENDIINLLNLKKENEIKKIILSNPPKNMEKIITELVTKEKIEINEINNFLNLKKNNIINKIDEINEKIKRYMNIENIMNPRYLENLEKYILSLRELYKNEINYLYEYKIIKDNFNFLSLNEILDKNIEEDYLKNLEIENIKLSDSWIQKICVDYLFKLSKNSKNDYEYISDLAKKLNYFEIFFTNESIEGSNLSQKLKEYKENPQKNLFKILEIITMLHPNEKVEEIRKYLYSIQSIEYIINGSEELGKIFLFSHSYPHLWDLDEYFDLLFPILRVNKLGYYTEGKKEYTLGEYLIYIQKLYFFYNINIKYLLSLHLDLEKYKEYISEASEWGVVYHLDNFFGKELNEYIKDININELKKDLENLKINVKSIENSLYTYENIVNIKQVDIEYEDYKEKIGVTLIESIDDYISVKESKVIIRSNYWEKEMVINKADLERHIKDLIELKKERKDLEEKINFLLIKLFKIKNGHENI